MTLIKDLIDIPDHVAGGDYVLSLSDGVERADETIGDYVVTDQLVGCFDSALKLIRDALDSVQTVGGTTTSTSKAAYLHGSFGSGKSHFMAVLDLLLAGNTTARSIPELGTVIANHDGWLRDRKFLLVPYHLIGATSLESAIFSGYVNWVRKEHPDAPLPAVYASDAVLDNANDLREGMGDDAFFASLNKGASEGGDRWGKMVSAWDADRYQAALTAPHDDDQHRNLVSSVVEALLPAFTELHGGFVTIDTGLSILSRHAQSLGYDGLILFLDELILWLAGRIRADLEWAREEGSKLAKLVESGDSIRPIPIVSFIARQRDLRELVGSSTGSEQLDFFDALQWWEGRFTTITLEDRNLPVIANRRLLTPKDPTAQADLDAAVDEAFAKYREARDVLLGDDTDRQNHAKLVYPFSPALVTTLVDVSSVLQRNRTALKVMQALLVSQRDTLRVGELIPVGELYDVVATEDQPFSEAMQRQFDQASTLYRNRIRPQLLAIHGLDNEAAIDDLQPDHAFHGHDRLAKTVILGALVSETPALRDLTAAKLEQLNAGSIESYIPGQERAEVIDLFRQLISRGVGELEMEGDPNNPRISLRLHGVDVEGIVANAKIEDNPRTRREKVRDLLAGAVDDEDLFTAKRHKLIWRGTPREVDIVFGNIRSRDDLPDDRLLADAQPKIVIDFPFDPDDHPPTDDLARVQDFRSGHDDTLTICWLPSHLNPTTRDQLGRLVVLDYLNAGDNFERHAAHLPQDDRATAQNQIRSQAGTLRAEMEQAFEEAYGIRPVTGSRFIDDALPTADQFQSLHHSLDSEIPAAANLAAALDKLSDQLLSFQFPAHPRFASGVRPTDVVRAWEQVQRAAQLPLGRLEFVKGERAVRDLMLRLAAPLELGETGENHFVLSDEWKNRMAAAIAEAEATDPSFVPTVGWMRARLDEPITRGLTTETANLVIATVALKSDYSFLEGDQPVPADIRKLDDRLILRRQELPDEKTWATAVINAQDIFGWEAADFRTADNVARLAAHVTGEAGRHRDDVRDLVEALDTRAGDAGAAPSANRLSTARVAAELVGRIANCATPIEVIDAIAEVEAPTSAAALGTSIKSAAQVSRVLLNTNWSLLRGAIDTGRDHSITTRLTEAIELDEHALPQNLATVIKRLEADATRVLVPDEPPPPPPGGPAPSGPLSPKGEESMGGAELPAFAEQLSSQLKPGQRIKIHWEIIGP